MNKQLQQLGFQEKFFHTGEVKLNYVVGPSNGQPLLFIPGQSVTWEEYTLLLPLLTDQFQVYAISLRGHGKSSWTPGQYTFNNLGKDLAAFLREVPGRPALVAGNSAGGVLAAWLAANAPDSVKGIILEDPPLFRCEWPAIKQTVVYDTFLAFSRMAVPGGGGLPYLLASGALNMPQQPGQNTPAKTPPKFLRRLMLRKIARKQALYPHEPLDLKNLPTQARIMFKSLSQFDGNFSRAFVDGSVGRDFDHAQTLARITQPVLFLHANWFMLEGRLVGALDDQDVEKAKSLVQGPWQYERLDCGHAIALDAPELESRLIKDWTRQYFS